MRTSSNKENRLLVFVIIILLVSGSFLFFQLLLPYHLYFKEQLKLFLFTTGYLLSYFDKPAWLASYCGDFLTQLFYLKGGGAATIAGLFLIEWLLMRKTIVLFGNRHFSSMWALFPVISDWIFYANIGYTVSLSVVIIITLLLFLLYTKVKNKWISAIAGILLMPFLYWTVGAGMFFFALILILYEIRQKQYRFGYWIILLLEAAVIPFILRPLYLLTFKQAYFYPYPGIQESGSFIILSIILILMLFKGIREMQLHIIPFTAGILLAGILLIAGIRVNVNYEREKILALSTEYYFGHANKVIELADEYDLSKPVASYYTNLALSERGQLGDRLMDFYQPFHFGLFLPVNEKADWFSIFFSSDVFFHVGDMNLATHSAMLGTIFSPYNQSSRLLVRLAEINVVNDDRPAAEKYIRILEATWFHKKRAKELKSFLNEANADDNPWLKKKRSQLAACDIIRDSGDYPASLNLLLESNPVNTEAFDYLLCFYLLNKDIKSFKATFDRYNTGFIPRVYQEALLIYYAVESAKKKELKKYNIDNQIIDDFNRYTALFEQTEGNLDAMQEAFPGTYWIYYHYATMKE